MRKQKGLSLSGFMVWAVILAFAALFGFKVGPAYMEYYSIQKQLKIVAEEAQATGAAGVDRRAIENAFDRRADVESITAISAKDLEISKDGGQIVITANYSVKVPMVGNLSACMDFNASSEK